MDFGSKYSYSPWETGGSFSENTSFQPTGGMFGVTPQNVHTPQQADPIGGIAKEGLGDGQSDMEDVGLKKQSAYHSLLSGMGFGGQGGKSWGAIPDNSFMTSYGIITPEIYGKLFLTDPSIYSKNLKYTYGVSETKANILEGLKDSLDFEGKADFDFLGTHQQMLANTLNIGSVYDDLMEQLGIIQFIRGGMAEYPTSRPYNVAKRSNLIFTEAGERAPGDQSSALEQVFIPKYGGQELIEHMMAGGEQEWNLNPLYAENPLSPQSFHANFGKDAPEGIGEKEYWEEKENEYNEHIASGSTRQFGIETSTLGRHLSGLAPGEGGGQLGRLAGSLNPTAGLMRGISGLAGLITGSDYANEMGEAGYGELARGLGIGNRPDSVSDFLGLASTGMKATKIGSAISEYGAGNVLGSMFSPGGISNMAMGGLGNIMSNKVGNYFGLSDSLVNDVTGALGNYGLNALAPGLGMSGIGSFLGKALVGDPISDVLNIRSQNVGRLGQNPGIRVGESLIDTAEELGGGYLKSHYGSLAGGPTWGQFSDQALFNQTMDFNPLMKQSLMLGNSEYANINTFGGEQSIDPVMAAFNAYSQSILGPSWAAGALGLGGEPGFGDQSLGYGVGGYGYDLGGYGMSSFAGYGGGGAFNPAGYAASLGGGMYSGSPFSGGFSSGGYSGGGGSNIGGSGGAGYGSTSGGGGVGGV